jgi:type VI secretion system ImpC/EvpB family protein
MDPQSAPAASAPDIVVANVTTTPAAAPAARAEQGLVDALQENGVISQEAAPLLERFLHERAPARALALWLGRSLAGRANLRRRVAEALSRDIAHIDGLLNRQVNAILHHPRFQKLEASWRGLRYLINQVPADEQKLKIRILNLSWNTLVNDLERALEFDQSQLFRKVYEEQFGMAGGEPFGVLLGDYELHLRPEEGYPTDDLEALRSISATAAAAFAPFVAAAHPSLLELTSFSSLERPLDLGRTYAQIEFVKWRSLRDSEDSRFVALTLPRVLMRLPYTEDSGRVDGFRFHEDVSAPDRSGYLWGNAAYAFGAVLIRTFATSAWLAAIRGVRRGEDAGGLVTGLPVHSFSTDHTGLVPKTSTEVLITDQQDKELSDHGFLSLCACPDTETSAFYGSASIQVPKTYDEMAATANARLSASLQYMLCVARFAHYIKVIARDKIGSIQTPGELEDLLRKWLIQYTNANDNASPEMKARLPLREAKVQIAEVAGKPGRYACEIHLRPHFQLDQLVSTVRLRTTVSGGQAG